MNSFVIRCIINGFRFLVVDLCMRGGSLHVSVFVKVANKIDGVSIEAMPPK